MRSPLTIRYGRLAIIALLMMVTSTVHAERRQAAGTEMVLNGVWDAGLERHYTERLAVPGLAGDPAKSADGTLWFKRTVNLPEGDWNQAQLTLHGARFAPEVYIDGERVSGAAGGMAPTVHFLRSTHVRPGATITLEIALHALKDMDASDASTVPQPDRWRSDNSSGLWDDVTLHFSRDARLVRVVPWTDWSARTLTVKTLGEGSGAQRLRVALLALDGRTVSATESTITAGNMVSARLVLGTSIRSWSPDHPELYRLHAALLDANGAVMDERTQTWGLREFTTRDRHFFLNGDPVQLRGGTVVWHRFLRDPAAPAIAWNSEWFDHNIDLRLKSYGANFLRFHLGLPPERLLDLCDRDGLLVQIEWPFFHGIKASDASMREQWARWLDVAMRHPSVVIVHAWNETSGDELNAGWKALNAVLAGYPPMVVAHRDTLHIHKYWWSLFENLGLYYDSADQFPKTIMVDEFGGDYLDPMGDAGQYPAVKETFLRFLGRKQSVLLRLAFHAEANARVAEYWRRLGAAGFAPFCILSSPQDGDSWFLGDLKQPKPMPVWDALAAAYSPQSVSLDLWDRNFLPGETIEAPLYFFNDRDAPAELTAELRVGGKTLNQVAATVGAHGHVVKTVGIKLPTTAGEWIVEARLVTPVDGVTHPIVSSWDVHTIQPQISGALRTAMIGVPSEDAELRTMLATNGLRVTTPDDPQATVVVTGSTDWANLQSSGVLPKLDAAVHRGTAVVMLDAGPRDLGQSDHPEMLGPLDGAPRLQLGEGYRKTERLFAGIRVNFNQLAEPESHMQTGPRDASLWQGMSTDTTWLWNGLRGGLVAPAAEMDVEGLGREGFLAQWAQRGADVHAIQSGSYFAYELAGYFGFSNKPNDASTMQALRKRVQFLVEDAPALQDVVNTSAKIVQTDLAHAFATDANGEALKMEVLATCGKSLTRAAVVQLMFAPGEGDVILSQALTAGRMLRSTRKSGEYGLRYDPAAEQFVLNMLAKAVSTVEQGPPVAVRKHGGGL